MQLREAIPAVAANINNSLDKRDIHRLEAKVLTEEIKVLRVAEEINLNTQNKLENIINSISNPNFIKVNT
jgi:hypothetical protein